jgi:Helix-turn-helix domain
MAALMKPTLSPEQQADILKQVGGMLRDARQAFKLELAPVSRDIHIPVSYLEALEKGDWSPLPGEVYARGYLKKYGEYLGFDQKTMIDRLQPPPPIADPIITPVLRQHRRPINVRPFLLLFAVVFAGIGVAALLSIPPKPQTTYAVQPVPESLVHYLDTEPLTPFYHYSCLQDTDTSTALWGCYAALRAEYHPVFPELFLKR